MKLYLLIVINVIQITLKLNFFQILSFFNDSQYHHFDLVVAMSLQFDNNELAMILCNEENVQNIY